MKGQRGITLVALVITVIVMLILAGVAISVLTGDGGLFGKSTAAAKAYNNSVNDENEKMNNILDQFNYAIDHVND